MTSSVAASTMTDAVPNRWRVILLRQDGSHGLFCYCVSEQQRDALLLALRSRVLLVEGFTVS